MAITISAAYKTNEEHREEYIRQHSALTDKLVKAIENICAHHRAAYENEVFASEQKRLDTFLTQRRPNQTAEEYYRELWVQEHMDYQAKRDAERRVRQAVEFIFDLTDHPQQCGYDHSEWEKHQAWAKDKGRPAFQAVKRPDSDAILREHVRKFVDQLVEQFCRKVRSKLTDIIVQHRDYECKLEYGSFSPGMFEGDVTLAFTSGISFRLHVIVKTNYSVLGNPYTQYPLTFHDVVAAKGAKPVGMLSEGEVHKMMKVTPWKPPSQKKPWTTVSVGDIVRTSQWPSCIVVGTRGEVATVYHHDSGEAKVSREHILAILARTKVDSWSGRKLQLRVTPHSSAAFEVAVPASVVEKINSMDYGPKKDTYIRKVCFPDLIRRLGEKSRAS